MGERENVLRFCAEQRSEMERIWKQLGRYESNGNAYNAWVQATHEAGPIPEFWDESWLPGARLPRPVWMRVELPRWLVQMRPNHRNTDIFGDVLRKFVCTVQAKGVLVMSEMWFKTYEAPDRDVAKVRELRNQDPESLADAPGRQEGLFMSLEHIAVGRRSWLAVIQHNPDRLLPWDEKNMDDAPLDSILTGIVNTGS